MKSISFLLIFLASGLLSGAATITAIGNGAWTAAGTWDLHRAPADGDVVVIPAGRTVSFNNTPYPQNNPPARPTLRLEITGILDFSGPGNDKLYLDAGSVIQLYVNGKILTSASSSEIIAIYTGSADNTVWTGSPSTINGPAYANASTVGFSSGILPLKLTSFAIHKISNQTAELTWVTEMESNTSHFDIQTFNGDQTWNTLATVGAAGNSTVNRSYSHRVSLKDGNNEFRLRMVDIDGKFSYSSVIRLVNSVGLNAAAIVYDAASRQIICRGQDISEGIVTVFDLTGKKVLTEKASNRIFFSPRAAGLYIASLSVRTTTVSKKIRVF